MTPHRRPVLNRCRARGHLAAVRIPIPADPSRFSFWADAEKTPCSALACSGCGLPVRSFPGLLVVGGAEARAALHAQGPEGVAGVTRGMSDYRLYVCPCASYSCGDFVGLSVAEDHPELGLPPSWGCAGHPPLAALPPEFSGVALPAAPDWPAFIEQRLQGLGTERTRQWAGIRWLRQLRGVLTGTRAATSLDTALRALLGSADPILRGYAIHVLWLTDDQELLALLPALLPGDADTLRSQPDPMGLADLYNLVATTIASQILYGQLPLVGPLQAALRAHALTPGRLDYVGAMLARHDREWFVAQFDALVAASPESAARALQWKREAGG